MKGTYVFELRCCIICHTDCLIHYHSQDNIEMYSNCHGSALYLARNRFKKLFPNCRKVKHEQIEVLQMSMVEHTAAELFELDQESKLWKKK